LNGIGKLTRTRASVALCFGLTVGLGGCRHKAQLVILPAVLTPVALEEIPELDNLPMVAVQPSNLPPVPAVASAEKPRRERKKPTPKTPVSEPVQIATAAPSPSPSPEETAIGALTAGGEANPQTKQEAADLITSSEKRLNAIPAQKAEDEKAQVSKVKNFLKDAQEALKTGDAEGAKTLATKAKLLLDDLEK
jgi:ribosomal protein S20